MPLKKGLEKYKPRGLFSEFYGNLNWLELFKQYSLFEPLVYWDSHQFPNIFNKIYIILTPENLITLWYGNLYKGYNALTPVPCD